ncbi:hypothetical protein [Thermus sp.]|uniref:hypothetical protein n=1 Tax=Thermus sp. TaxID=275 RepID=UPI00307D5525
MRSLALSLLLGLALAQVRLGPLPPLQGSPGAYLSLNVEAEGQGPVRFQLLLPEGWQALSDTREALLEGKGVVAFTLRVPEAPAGTQAPVAVVALEGGVEVARSQGVVEVLARTELRLSVPEGLEAPIGAPFEFPLYLVNASNHRETVFLRAEGAVFQIYLNPQSLDLDPGEARSVRVTVVPQGQVGSGYPFYLKLRAEPRSAPQAAREVGALILFKDPLLASGRGKDPELTLALRMGMGLGLAFSSQASPAFSLGYTLAPALSGALSDYYTATLETAPLSGTWQDPWNPPQSAGFSLKGEALEMRGTYGGGAYRLQSAYRAGAVRSSLDLGYQPGGVWTLALGAVSQDPGLDLQGSLSTQLKPDGRQDALGVRYRLPLGGGFLLGAGLDLAGQMAEGYALTLALQETLSWQTQGLDLTQTYAGVPAAGLHAFGLSGGTRSLYPLGLRGQTSFQLSGQGGLWQSGLTLYLQPVPGALLSLGGTYRQAPEGRSFGLAPGFSATFAEPGVYAGSLYLAYGLNRVLEGQGPEGETFQAGLSLSAGALSLSGGLLLRDLGARGLEASLGLRYSLGALGYLQGLYQQKESPEGQSLLYGGSWSQLWEGGLVSELLYRREVTGGQGTQRFGLTLGQRDFLLPGLSLSGGYALLLLPEGLRHALSLSLGYTQAITFPTPRPVVDLFGGRRSGEVAGRLFRDENLNDQPDPGEEGLGGVQVCLGGVCETTDGEGRFRLLVPVGRYAWTFRGLPATLALLSEAPVQVDLNAHLDQDLPVAPAVALEVRVLDDGNRNGQEDPEERGIAYAGVCAEGPVTRCARADENGRALLAGLFQGTYRLKADPRYLPPGYGPGPEATLQIAPPTPPAPIWVSALPPRREVEITYRAGDLALVGSLAPLTPLAGEEVEVRALAQGDPEAVYLLLPEGSVALKPQGEGYFALRLRLRLPAGYHTLILQAVKGGERVESPLGVHLAQGPLYSPEVADRPDLLLTLRFRAQAVRLVGEGGVYELKSEDGYTWKGTLPLRGVHTLRVVADGEELGPLLLRLPGESAGEGSP